MIYNYNEFLNEGFLDNLNPIKNIWNALVNKVKSFTNKIKGSIDLNYDFSFNGFTQFIKDYNSGKINIDEFISDNQDIINNLNQELNEGIIKNILMLAIVFCLAQSCKKSEKDFIDPYSFVQFQNYDLFNDFYKFNEVYYPEGDYNSIHENHKNLSNFILKTDNDSTLCKVHSSCYLDIITNQVVSIQLFLYLDKPLVLNNTKNPDNMTNTKIILKDTLQLMLNKNGLSIESYDTNHINPIYKELIFLAITNVNYISSTFVDDIINKNIVNLNFGLRLTGGRTSASNINVRNQLLLTKQ